MTVAMIMSKDYLEQEHAMLHRLVVGLLDEGIQVIRVVPESETESLPSYETTVTFAKRIETPMPVSRMLRNKRREDIEELFTKHDVSTIVGYGKDAMKLALDVAHNLEVRVMCEVVSMKDAMRVKKKLPIWRWLAATPSIEQEIARRVGVERVALVPLGVTNHNSKTKDCDAHHTCVVVLDAAGDVKNTNEILESLTLFPNIHIFLELAGKHQQRIWKQIRKLEMHDRVTCLRDVSALRQLVVHADLVVLPSATMPVRTVLLEAMLRGVPILATQMQGFDMLIDEETAIIVQGSWENGLSILLDDPSIGHRIGALGSTLIAQKYGSAVQIAAFEAACTL